MDQFFNGIGQPSPTVTDCSADGTLNTPNPYPVPDTTVRSHSASRSRELLTMWRLVSLLRFGSIGLKTSRRRCAPQHRTAATSVLFRGAMMRRTGSSRRPPSTWSRQRRVPRQRLAWWCSLLPATTIRRTADPTLPMSIFRHHARTSLGAGARPRQLLPKRCGTMTRERPTATAPAEDFRLCLHPLPSWQIGAPNGPGRMVPDVAANADPNTGYNIVLHGETTTRGGTSAVAPLYAGPNACVR